MPDARKRLCSHAPNHLTWNSLGEWRLMVVYQPANSKEYPISYHPFHKHGLILIFSSMDKQYQTTVKCVMKLCIHSQTSTTPQLKFGNE